LRIWSAGCSTGEEPYTIAIILHEVLRSEIAAWDIRITANDLSEAVLAQAREAVYGEYSLRTTPKEIVSRYFSQDGTDFRLKPEVKRLVSFGQINLSDRAQLKRVERSHIVFCRNVIIYFDDEMKKNVINAFYDNLLPGGYLLIGHSESLHNISRAFRPKHYPGAIIYSKEE
jgi:chemotaxis protein methyltransferase CheR